MIASYPNSLQIEGDMFFDRVELGALDPIFGLGAAFKADPRSEKVDLLVGVYRDEELKTHPLTCAQDLKISLSAEYLPIDGMAAFVETLAEVVFGPSWASLKARTYGTQALGGTGALRVGGDFFVREVNPTLFLPDLTWPNHLNIFTRAGCRIERYPVLDRDKMRRTLEGKEGVVLLHVVCQNPTGIDPTLEEWRSLATWFRGQKLLPFFDFAYQGFGAGIAEDRAPLELFAAEGCEFAVAYSCSKNFSLYGERVGALYIATKDAVQKEKVGSQVKRIIRGSISNPPTFGAALATQVLSRKRREWEAELAQMRGRLDSLRTQFFNEVGRWSELRHGRGMFTYLGLSEAQVKQLRDQHAIYTPEGGRINFAALNRTNLPRVIKALQTLCH